MHPQILYMLPPKKTNRNATILISSVIVTIPCHKKMKTYKSEIKIHTSTKAILQTTVYI